MIALQNFARPNGRLLDLASACKDVLHGGLRWWWRELQALLPTKILRLLPADRSRRFTFVSEKNSIHVIEVDDAHASIRRFSKELGSLQGLHKLMEQYRSTQGGIEFGMRVAGNEAFYRELVIPASARLALREILVQDLHHNTPFSPETTFHDYVVRPIADDRSRFRVCHVIIRRDIVEKAVARLGLTVQDLDFLDWPVEGSFGILKLKQPKEQPRDQSRRLQKIALCIAGVIFLSALFVHWALQKSKLAELDADLMRLRPQVARTQVEMRRKDAHAEMLQQLRQRRMYPSLAENLDLLTKALPDDSWLQSIEIDDMANSGRRQMSIAGFSADAARLVTLFDGSNAFTDSAITSAIAFDPNEKREHFTLRTTTKSPALPIIENQK